MVNNKASQSKEAHFNLKIALFQFIGFVSLCFIFTACTKESKAPTLSFEHIEGQTMGTFYQCTFETDVPSEVIKKGLDSVFQIIDFAASTYNPNSIISKINKAGNFACFPLSNKATPMMRELFEITDQIVLNTNNYFDPSLGPIINYWGFGADRRRPQAANQDSINYLFNFVGWDRLTDSTMGQEWCVVKHNEKVSIDMNAIAKGYGVDIVGKYFEQMDISNYYINIGGEILVKGNNKQGTLWTLGINLPDKDAPLNAIVKKIQLDNKAMASSGNYRSFYEENGKTFVHTINPKTGLAKASDLLQATIIAENCALADAYATACMAMGIEKAIKLVEERAEIEAFFIYTDSLEKADELLYYATDNIKSKIIKE